MINMFHIKRSKVAAAFFIRLETLATIDQWVRK